MEEKNYPETNNQYSRYGNLPGTRRFHTSLFDNLSWYRKWHKSPFRLPVHIVIALLALFGAVTIIGSFYHSVKTQAAVGINEELPFQGRLTNPDGTVVADGDYDIVFSLYKLSAGGSAVWTESHTGGSDISVKDGVFEVDLGSITALSGLDFNDDSFYLGINVEGDGEMSPRIRLGAAPYAHNSDELDGVSSEEFLILDGQASGQIAYGGTAASENLVLRSTSNATKGDILLVDDGGDVIVGTAGNGTLSVPGSGTNSEQLGSSAVASGSRSLAVGYSADAVGDWGVAVGYQAYAGPYGTYIGYQSGNSGETGQSEGNIGIGWRALNSITTGDQNIVLGSSARNLTTGDENVVIGPYAANQMSTGNRNTIIGSEALGNGAGALGNLTGSHNTLLGWRAGSRLGGTQSGNTLIGSGSGQLPLVQFSNATVLGNQAVGQGPTGLDRAVVIGHNAARLLIEDLTDTLWIETQSTIPNGGTGRTTPLIWGDFSGRQVGIDTKTPGAALGVFNSSSPQLRLTQNDSVDYADFRVDSSGYLNVSPSGHAMTIDAGNMTAGAHIPLTVTGTMNAGGGTFTGLFVDLQRTTGFHKSKPIKVDYDGSEVFSVNGLGVTVIAGSNNLDHANNVGVDISHSWGSFATHYGIKYNATVASSQETSKLIDLQSGGSSKFQVQRFGQIENVQRVTSTSTTGLSMDATWVAGGTDVTGILYNVSTHTSSGGSSKLLDLQVGSTSQFFVGKDGTTVIGDGALATSATDGFLYIASVSGTPSGVPTTFAGRIPITYDTSADDLYFYNGGWVKVNSVKNVDENIRVLRGSVATGACAPVAGTGFVPAPTGPADCSITFTTPFAGPVTVTATTEGPGPGADATAQVFTSAPTGFGLESYLGGVPTPGLIVHFEVTGP